jgi:hypothetical protein
MNKNSITLCSTAKFVLSCTNVHSKSNLLSASINQILIIHCKVDK